MAASDLKSASLNNVHRMRHYSFRAVALAILVTAFVLAREVDGARPVNRRIEASNKLPAKQRRLAEQVSKSSCSINIDLEFTANDFPTNFRFGSATAAYQIEGAAFEDGRGPCIWDQFATVPGKIDRSDNATVADDSYHLYEEDIELLKAMGVSTYRFSISWSRILPDGTGAVNPKGVQYYNKLIDGLLAADILPAVTLYHWDLPLSLHENMGGWLNASIVESFEEYAELCFREYGDRVKTWITFNEPGNTAVQGYGNGAMAPGRCSNHTLCTDGGNSSTEPYIVAHNILRSHAAAVKVFRDKYQATQGGRIGITLDSGFPFPASNSSEDREASDRALQFSFGWWADPVFTGDYPAVMKELVGQRLPTFTINEQHDLKGSADFLGVNSYTGVYVTQGGPPEPGTGMPWTDGQVAGSPIHPVTGNLIGEPTGSSWLLVVPSAIYHLTKWINHRYTNIPLLVTENGVSEIGNMTLPSALCDQHRISFYEAYLKELLRAIRDGVQIEAYYAWSLLDNFEWARGYGERFGIHWVDFTDPRRPRIPKMSAHWWRYFLQTP